VPVTLPSFGPFDTGVFSAIEERQLTQAEKEGAAVGVRLDECTHVAPGRWVLRGAVLDGGQGGTVALAGFGGGDVFTGTSYSLHLRGPGEFTLPVQLRGGIALEAERASRCQLEVGGLDRLTFVDVTSPSTPLTYTAPDSTMQALGNGARMDQRETLQYQLAVLAWLELSPPFDAVWLPADVDQRVDAGDSLLYQFGSQQAGAAPTNCVRFDYGVVDGRVEESAGCSRVPSLADDVEGAPGFKWVADSADGEPVAVLELDDRRVSVGGSDRDTVTRLAGSLTRVPNATFTPPSIRTVDQLLADGLGRFEYGPMLDGVQRARTSTGTDDDTSVWTGHLADGRSVYAVYSVGSAEGRPIVSDLTGGMWVDCVDVSGSSFCPPG